MGVGARRAVRRPLVDALLVAGHQAQGLAAVGHLGVGGHLLAGGLGDAPLRAHGVQDAPGDGLVGAGLDPLVLILRGRPGLDAVAPRGGLGVGEDQPLDRDRDDVAVGGAQLGRAGVVHAHLGVEAGGVGAGPRAPPDLAVPGVRAVVGVAVGQADDHLVLVGVVARVGQPAVPGLRAVAPLAGAAHVVEVVERVAGPGARDGGHERALGLGLGGVRTVPQVLEVGQGAGGHQGSAVAQVALIDEVLGLPVVEHGDVRLGHALELRVVGPLEPLDRIDVAARAAGGEDCGERRPRGGGARRRGNGVRTEHKGRGRDAQRDEARQTTTHGGLAEVKHGGTPERVYGRGNQSREDPLRLWDERLGTATPPSRSHNVSATTSSRPARRTRERPGARRLRGDDGRPGAARADPRRGDQIT